MAPEPRTYRFGDVEVEPLAHRAARAGADLDLEPKAFAVLVALLEQPGRAFERDELLDRVWGHRHVTPGVLNRVVAQLRKALGDSAENPRYIQTLHSLGYRFIADVQVASDDTRGTPPPVDRTARPSSVEPPARSARYRTHAVVVAASVVFAIIAALWWWWQHEPARPPASVAVLPFVNLGGDAHDDYFVDGLTEEMRSALAGIDGLKVAASVSTSVRNAAADARVLGSKLGVACLLEASVRRQGTRIRINARLSDTTSGFTLWSRTYDRELADVFDTQTRIADDVVHSLLGAIPGAQRILAKRLAPTRDVAAFDDYLKGLHQLDDAAPDDAIGLFGQALQKDSGFARAQAGICSAQIRKFENQHSADAFENARIACQRALTMDSSLADVGLALGDLFRAEGRTDEALAQYRDVEHAPETRTLAQIGQARVYAAQGKHELASEHFREALRLSPDDAFVHSEVGYQQYLDGDVPNAIASFRTATALRPDSAGLWVTLGALCMEAGDNTQAERALQRSIDIEPSYEALSNLGLLKYQYGDYAAAAAFQRRAAALNPLDFMVWGNLGMALKADPSTAAQAREAYGEAAKRVQRYLELKPDDARATAAFGLYRAELADPAQARELARRAEALGSQPGEVALLNAETFAVLGDPDAARQRLASARAAGIAESLIAGNATFKRHGLTGPTPSQRTARP